ncbi:hypothetical protein JW758_02635 [Candidatus Peregrinibacteria bacterium]|nr:hypothetical protein [Candidatus Peregrinibacteria bacterium]
MNNNKLINQALKLTQTIERNSLSQNSKLDKLLRNANEFNDRIKEYEENYNLLNKI